MTTAAPRMLYRQPIERDELERLRSNEPPYQVRWHNPDFEFAKLRELYKITDAEYGHLCAHRGFGLELSLANKQTGCAATVRLDPAEVPAFLTAYGVNTIDQLVRKNIVLLLQDPLTHTGFATPSEESMRGFGRKRK